MSGEKGLGRALHPRDAATLIIVDRAEAEPRVLMGKRHHGHVFMPGKFVFPGGRIEPEDRRMAAAGALDPVVEEKLNCRVPRPSPSFARAIALAAIRETFEETGLAIGVADYGAPEDPPRGAWARFAAAGVYPALDGIDFVARAITPPGRVKRFDARFLVVDARAIAKRVDGVVHPGGGTGGARLDAARRSARARSAQHHPPRPCRSRRGAGMWARPAPPAALLSRVARQAAAGGALSGLTRRRACGAGGSRRAPSAQDDRAPPCAVNGCSGRRQPRGVRP